MNKIKVLVVDDSAFMRKAIENMLKKDADIEVIGNARNGKEALEKIKELNPDVVTLDIEMPVMDGLEALKHIMKEMPRPVIMVSSLTTEGAEATLKALELGAVDFIAKDKSFASFGIMKIEDQLIRTVKHFARRRIFSRSSTVTHKTQTTQRTIVPPRINNSGIKTPKKIIAIGTSTGGPQSLQKVIPRLDKSLNKPVLVVQHMPPNFTKSLAQRLNSLSSLTVVEAQGKEKLEPNVVYVAKGGFHLKLRKMGSNYYIELADQPSNVLHIPSVDEMVGSVADTFGNAALGVIMTGMGSDGLKGLTKLKSKGGYIIAQDEKSCIVYGMPRAVVEAGIADEIVPLEKIAESIMTNAK
jgi:two-component system chemotaxis response regulator CheB